MSFADFLTKDGLRIHAPVIRVSPFTKACKHVWVRTSSQGTPVLGISRCRMCRALASGAHIRAWQTSRNAAQIAEHTEKEGFDDMP